MEQQFPNNNQQHSQNLKPLLLEVPIQQQKQHKNKKHKNTQQQNIEKNTKIENTQTSPQQTQQNIQQQNTQHSPSNSSINTTASCSSTVFPTSPNEQIEKITCFPVILPNVLDEQNITTSDIAFPSSSFQQQQNISEQQKQINLNKTCCPNCKSEINIEPEKQQNFEKQQSQKHILKNKKQKLDKLIQKEENLKNNNKNKNIIIIPPPLEQQKQITSMPEGQNEQENEEDGGTSHIKLLQLKIFEHYHTVAYTLIILTYFLAFCEYLYLRLVSFIFPEPIIYRRKCEKHYNEIVYRNELHFAAGLAVFLVMGIYQILCFFLLTNSKRVLDIRRTTFSQVLSIEERLHHELVFAIRRTMFKSLYPTFFIYILCSSVIYCDIFYMIGLRDPIVHGGSRIIIYVFDAFVLLYFFSFPVICVIFHPEIICFRKRLSRICCCFTCILQNQRRRRDRENAQQFGNSQSLQTNDEEIVVVSTNIPASTSNTEETKSERQQANIFTTDDNNSSINTKHLRKQQSVSETLSEDETISGGNDSRTRNFIGRRQRFSIQQEVNQPIKTKQQRQSNINYGSLERRQPCTSENTTTIDSKNNQKQFGDKISTQTEAVRKRLQQRRQSRYKRLKGSDKVKDEGKRIEEVEEGKEGREKNLEDKEAKEIKEEADQVSYTEEEISVNFNKDLSEEEDIEYKNNHPWRRRRRSKNNKQIDDKVKNDKIIVRC